MITSNTLITFVKAVILASISLYIAACQVKTENTGSTSQATDATIKVTPTSDTADNTGLDILTDYDRDVWDGPAGWTEEQWRWKRLLRWNKDCDYVADIHTHTLSDAHDLIQVMCIPGSYQAIYYLFLFNKNSQHSKQLALGAGANTDSPYDISGHLTFNKDTLQLSITTLSRGVGDCGIYRTFNFRAPDGSIPTVITTPTLIEMRQRNCDDKLPSKTAVEKTIFDPTQWPLVNPTR